MNDTRDREPEPTEFHVILEGDPHKPRRIPTVWVRHHPPAKYVVGDILWALLDAAYAREEAEIRPVIVTGADA
jgi:hypothetical protein